MARILIVDDNLLIRTLLREILVDGGHEVSGEAKDGIEAATRCAELRPDLVTLDLVMPQRDGIATIEHLHAVDPKLTVVICSAWLTEHNVIAALELGAKGFIHKPFDRQAVLETISRVLADARAPERAAAAEQAQPSIDADADPDERREFARVSAKLRVALIGLGATPIETSTIDISGGGMLLDTPTLEPGTSVGFRLELDAGQPPVEGRARAVRSRGETLALAFEQVSITDHERLTGYIQDHLTE